MSIWLHPPLIRWWTSAHSFLPHANQSLDGWPLHCFWPVNARIMKAEIGQWQPPSLPCVFCRCLTEEQLRIAFGFVQSIMCIFFPHKGPEDTIQSCIHHTWVVLSLPCPQPNTAGRGCSQEQLWRTRLIWLELGNCFSNEVLMFVLSACRFWARWEQGCLGRWPVACLWTGSPPAPAEAVRGQVLPAADCSQLTAYLLLLQIPTVCVKHSKKSGKPEWWHLKN